jgi:hypothetical protein
MPDPRRRYQVRLRKAVAGSFLAAASAASLTGFTAAPALAAPLRVVSASPDSTDHEAGEITLGLDSSSSIAPAAPVTATTGLESSEERLAGVRADLDRAVLLHLVTPEQADGFYAQIERRVAAGR